MANKYSEKFVCLVCLERGASQQLRALPKDELSGHMVEHLTEDERSLVSGYRCDECKIYFFSRPAASVHSSASSHEVHQMAMVAAERKEDELKAIQKLKRLVATKTRVIVVEAEGSRQEEEVPSAEQEVLQRYGQEEDVLKELEELLQAQDQGLLEELEPVLDPDHPIHHEEVVREKPGGNGEDEEVVLLDEDAAEDGDDAPPQLEPEVYHEEVSDEDDEESEQGHHLDEMELHRLDMEADREYERKKREREQARREALKTVVLPKVPPLPAKKTRGKTIATMDETVRERPKIPMTLRAPIEKRRRVSPLPDDSLPTTVEPGLQVEEEEERVQKKAEVLLKKKGSDETAGIQKEFDRDAEGVEVKKKKDDGEEEAPLELGRKKEVRPTTSSQMPPGDSEEAGPSSHGHFTRRSRPRVKMAKPSTSSASSRAEEAIPSTSQGKRKQAKRRREEGRPEAPAERRDSLHNDEFGTPAKNWRSGIRKALNLE